MSTALDRPAHPESTMTEHVFAQKTRTEVERHIARILCPSRCWEPIASVELEDLLMGFIGVTEDPRVKQLQHELAQWHQHFDRQSSDVWRNWCHKHLDATQRELDGLLSPWRTKLAEVIEDLVGHQLLDRTTAGRLRLSYFGLHTTWNRPSSGTDKVA